MKLSTLSMALLATAVTATASPAIHLPGVKDASQLDASVWSINKEEASKDLQSTRFLAPAAEASQINFRDLWIDRIEDCDGEAEEMYSKLVALQDGNYLEVYTSGAGKLFYEGRVTLLNSKGEEQWSKAIQLGSYTRAIGASQDAAGNIFVSCTTKENNLTVPYVVSFSTDGTQGITARLGEGSAYSSFIAVEGLDNGFVALYSEGQSAWDWSFKINLTKRDAQGNETGSCTATASAGESLGAKRLDDILMVPFSTGEALFFNLADATLALSDQTTGYASFHNGCVSGDALYLVSAPWGGLVNITKYEVKDVTVEKAWTKETPLYHKNYNLYAFPGTDGDVIIYVKTSEKPAAIIMDSEGGIVAQNNAINFDIKNNTNWVYSGGQLEDGTVALFGMTMDTYELAIMTLDLRLRPIQVKDFTNIKADHPYSYSYDNCSQLIGDDFLFSGFIRPTDYWNHGHTPVFALLNAETKELEWAATGDPGTTIRIEPKHVTVDDQGNSYAMYLSFATTRLSRYDANGKVEWSNILAPEKYDNYIAPTILSNGNVLAGVMATDKGLKLDCFNTSGESVFSLTDNSFCGYKMAGAPAITEIGNTGDVLIGFPVYTDECSYPYLVKVTAEGKVAFAKVLEGFDAITEPVIVAIASDSNDGAIISGSALCDYDVTCPMIASVDAEGNTIWATYTPTDVYCPIAGMALNNAGVIYAYANTGYHGVLFAYDEATGAVIDYDVYSEDTNMRSNYEAIVIDQDGNAVIGASFIGENWSSYDAKAIAFNAKAERFWDVTLHSEQGDRYACSNIGIIDGKVAILAIMQNYNSNGNEILAFVENNEISSTIDCLPSDGLNGFQFCTSAIKDDRAYIFYMTKMGENVYYGNLCCVGASEGETKLEQTIEWNQELADVNVGDVIELTAAATSGLEVTYTIIKGADLAEISDSTLTILAEGEIEIEAIQNGNDQWLAAEPVVKTISASAGIMTIEADIQSAVYFNLQGVRMPQGQLPAGIYIKRQGNHTEKVIIR